MTDLELLESSRSGSNSAYAELWTRHHRAGRAASRGLAPHLDADDLVSEAYLKILDLVQRDKGPRGAFRPYLYQVIRSLAADWSKTPESPSEHLDELPEHRGDEPWDEGSFDLATTSQAFNSLNERWQSVLWYTEVEGLQPRHAAKLLGLSPNSTSALAKRAREALRSAWVEAHVNRQLAEAACQSTLEHPPRYQKGTATNRVRADVEARLDTCPRCRNASEELTYISQRLALVLSWIFVGGSAVALLTNLGTPTAQAAVLAAPALSASKGAGGISSTPFGASASSTSGSAAGGGAAAGASATTVAGAAMSAPGIILTAAASVLAVSVAGAAIMMTGFSTEESIAVPPTTEEVREAASPAQASPSRGDEHTANEDADQTTEEAAVPERLPPADSPSSEAMHTPPASVSPETAQPTAPEEPKEQTPDQNAEPEPAPEPDPRPEPAPEPHDEPGEVSDPAPVEPLPEDPAEEEPGPAPEEEPAPEESEEPEDEPEAEEPDPGSDWPCFIVDTSRGPIEICLPI